MKRVAMALAVALALPACANGDTPYSEPLTQTYSQTALLKNWTMSACLAFVAKDAQTRADANQTASAYMEFSQLDIEAFEALRALAERYATRRYAGSVDSEFNAMKCIDLFNSEELDQLARRLAQGR